MHPAHKSETITMTHSKETIRRLSKVQYKSFSGIDRVLWYILSLMLIASGFGLIFSFRPPITYISLAMGCLVFTNVGITAKLNANQVIDQIEKSGGRYPSTTVAFYEKDMQITEHTLGKQVRYLKYAYIRKLVEDEAYLYLFVSDKAAYMLPKSEIKDLKTLKQQLEASTALRFVPPSQLLTYSLADMLRKRRKNAVEKEQN